MQCWERFVALGDSFTEGLHDEVGADGRHRGWADRVAQALASRAGGVQYANLAVRGRLLDEVVREQLAPALAVDPDLVSFHAGGNDVLRPGADLEALGRRYEAAVARLRASGATVVLFTVLERSGGGGRMARALSARIARFNEQVVRRTAAHHDVVLVDVGRLPALHDRRLWDEDRLHLAPAGHRRVAAAMLQSLGVHDPGLLGGAPGWWRRPLDAAPPPRRGAVLRDDLRWAHRHLLPWIGRRLRGVSSGDTVLAKRPTPVEVRPE